jgi:hypothetical protein
MTPRRRNPDLAAGDTAASPLLPELAMDVGELCAD